MQPDTPELAQAKAAAEAADIQPDIAIGDKELDILRKRVQQGLTVTAFVEGDMGKLMIQWINSEISRLTTSLISADLDDQPMKTVAVRAELRAFSTIASRMQASQSKAAMAKSMLRDSGAEVPGEDDDLRSPEEIAKDEQ